MAAPTPGPSRTAYQRCGALLEERAAELLRDAGFQILLRNFRCRGGELDIVARRGELLVIAEVRLRASSRFGGAAASIGESKRRRLLRAARYLLLRRPALQRLAVRFDALLASHWEGPIEWLENVL